MPRTYPRWSALACLGLLGLGTATATTTGLRTAPAWLTLEPTQKSAELSLSNTSNAPLHAQVRLYLWVQEHGEEQLLPTRELAVSPPIIEIPAGQQQRVRVIRLDEPRREHEGSYRLIIDQLPRQDMNGPQTVLRYSAPVFVAAPQPGTPRLIASLVQQAGRTLLRVDNHGKAHARLADLGYRDAGGQRTEVAARLAGYVLPGQYKVWQLPDRPGGYRDGHFMARVNQDRTERRLDIAPTQ